MKLYESLAAGGHETQELARLRRIVLEVIDGGHRTVAMADQYGSQREVLLLEEWQVERLREAAILADCPESES